MAEYLLDRYNLYILVCKLYDPVYAEPCEMLSLYSAWLRNASVIQDVLWDIQLFHTDLGSVLKNQLIDGTLAVFQIGRSLNIKGCP